MIIVIIELCAVILAMCAAGYAVHRRRESAEWARLRGEWLERLKKLDNKIREGR